jgi:hypothetical protein
MGTGMKKAILWIAVIILGWIAWIGGLNGEDDITRSFGPVYHSGRAGDRQRLYRIKQNIKKVG